MSAHLPMQIKLLHGVALFPSHQHDVGTLIVPEQLMIVALPVLLYTLMLLKALTAVVCPAVTLAAVGAWRPRAASKATSRQSAAASKASRAGGRPLQYSQGDCNSCSARGVLFTELL